MIIFPFSFFNLSEVKLVDPMVMERIASNQAWSLEPITKSAFVEITSGKTMLSDGIDKFSI